LQFNTQKVHKIEFIIGEKRNFRSAFCVLFVRRFGEF